MKTKMTSN